MLDSAPAAIIMGIVLGFLSGLGIGGGSLLFLWLTLAAGMDPAEARGINLLFFLPCAPTAGFFRWRQGTVPFRKILPAILWGCISALLFSLLGTRLDTPLLKKLFGGLLVVTGLREIFQKPKETGAGH